MTIRNDKQRIIRPTHPGEMLREDFLPDYGLSVSRFAEALGVSRQTVNELLRERRSVSFEMALRLSRLFGNSPQFWLNAQRARRSLECGKNDWEEDREDIAVERRVNDLNGPHPSMSSGRAEDRPLMAIPRRARN